MKIKLQRLRKLTSHGESGHALGGDYLRTKIPKGLHVYLER